MTYRNAFNCKRCPESNGPKGCPMWWETVWESPQAGETKIVKSCGYTQLPLYLTEVIKASNRPAAATEGLRNQVALLANGVRAINEIPHGGEAKRLAAPISSDSR